MKDTWNMTPDEARKYILQNWFDGDENVNAFVCGDEEYTAVAIAVEALEATKWHYPSKGEYPPKEQEYFVAFKTDKEIYCDVRVLNPDLNNLLLGVGEQIYAWQYIIPPKEEGK